MANRTDFIKSKAREVEQTPAVGVVTKVFEHDDPNDKSNHEANVRLVNDEEEFRRIPIHVGRNGEARMPREGDFVQIGFVGGKTNRPFVSSFAYSNTKRAPLARAGHWRQQFGDSSPHLYVEAEPSDHSAGSPDVIRLAKKADGLSDPSTKVEIDDSGSVTKVNVETDGEVEIKDTDGGSVSVADGTVTVDGGSVVLGDGGTALLKDVTVSTTTDADGHVTSVSLNKTRSNVSETQ